MKSKVRILYLELKTCAIRMSVCILIAVCLMALAIAMADFSVGIPKALKTYMLLKVDFDSYDVSCRWMNADELDMVQKEVEKENLELIDITGEKNHISATVSAKDYEQCIRIVDKLRNRGFSVYCEAYSVIKRLLDDISFYEQLFRGLFIVSFTAFLALFVSCEMMLLLAERKRIGMLFFLGYSRLKLWLFQFIRTSIGLITITVLSVFSGRQYEKYALELMKELFGGESGFYVSKAVSWPIVVKMFLTAELCMGLILMWFMQKGLLRNKERIA